METTLAWFGVGAGILALLFSLFTMMQVLKESMGNDKMKALSIAVQEGAMAYMNRQYKTLIPFVAVVFILLWVLGYVVEVGEGSHLPLGWQSAVSFLVGAVCSAIAGYIGMNSTTKANARTAEAARSSGLGKALKVSFRAGAVMGMAVAGLGLLGVSVLYLLFCSGAGDASNAIGTIDSFAFGASMVAFFARVGGGIYTKAADVGADLVGKVEAGIPEDDPRNPATIADNVGDNVGDTAGMGADLFESYGATTIAAMLLGATVFSESLSPLAGVLFPMLVGAIGIVASIIGTFTVKTSEGGNPQAALNVGLWVTNILTAVGVFFLAKSLFADFDGLYIGIFFAVVAGLIVNILVGKLTGYYTASSTQPVKNIAGASNTVPATNIIQGLSVGMASVFIPMLVFAAAIIFSFNIVECYAPASLSNTSIAMYGIAMAALGMLFNA
ncbi:MAG: sodium/proton-translocating pyrophosphatase, partial [Clostridia bacterium]|nr:sodium/proton-translocating pyrophosphatase [Clostridia bacterium]